MLLSPSSGIWFSSFMLPLPGHVLIYGPTVSTASEYRFSLSSYNIERQKKLLSANRLDFKGIRE